MKINPLTKLLAICLLVTAIACNKQPCACDFNPKDFMTVKLVNQQGQSLISGPGAIYNADSLRLLRQRDNTDTSGGWISRLPADSSQVLINYPLPREKTFIYYNSQATRDSIELVWVTKTGKCCDAPQIYSDIVSVKFNGQAVVPQNGVYTFVK